MEHESEGDTSCNWRTRNGPRRLGKETGRAGNRRTCFDHPNYSINKISQNTEESPRDLRKLALRQISVKDNQLTLFEKTCKKYDNDNHTHTQRHTHTHTHIYIYRCIYTDVI